MYIRIINVLIVLLLPCLLLCQSVENNKQSADFESQSVSSNGGMNYGMPLLSVSGDFLSKSIGLNYYGGSGIKVSELSTNVGMGWSLSGIDVITRKVNGIPDEGYKRLDILGINLNGEDEEEIGKVFKGWLQQPIAPDAPREDHYLCSLGVRDSAADDFHYTAGSYSGSFHFEHTDLSSVDFENINFNEIEIINHQMNNVFIEVDYQFDDDELISHLEFTITTPEGQVYHYGGLQGTKRLEDKSASLSTGVSIDKITQNAGVVNAWRIKNIESTIDEGSSNRDVIEYEYDYYESYAYVDYGTQKSMMKDITGLANSLTDNGASPAITHLYHDYFNKYFAQKNNDASDTNGDKKNHQNILYDRATWSVVHYINALRLKKIKSKYEVIEFTHSPAVRKDLYTGPFVDIKGDPLIIDGISGVSLLSGYDSPRAVIGVKQYVRDDSPAPISESLRLVKRYNFEIDYYQNIEGADVYVYDQELDGSIQGDDISDAADNLLTVDCNRLILKSISLVDNNADASSSEQLKTKFSYDLQGFGGTITTKNLARRCSLGQDYWGYNNGVTTETSAMIPILPFETNASLRPHLSDADCWSTQDRISKWPEMRAGVLTNIQMPSGAQVTYTYGANEVKDYPLTYLNQSSNNIVGGVRLERTTVRDSDNEILYEEELSYERIIDATDPSVRELSGKLLYIPTFIELFDKPGQSMRIHNGNYAGDNNAVCQDARSVSVRGMIYSSSITPRVTGTGHIGYTSVIKQVDKGFTETQYIMPSDEELLGSSTPQAHSFGVKRYIKPSSDEMMSLALQRGQVSAMNIYEEDAAGTSYTLVSESSTEYNSYTGQKDYVLSSHEYGGMPFQRDYKWKDQFRIKLGSSFSNPVNVSFMNLDIPSSCRATKVDNSTSGGQNNYFATQTNEQIFGRVEKSRLSAKVDGVTTVTRFEYQDFTVEYHGVSKAIHVPKRVFTFNEITPSQQQIKVLDFAGEGAYSDPNHPSYPYHLANSPLLKYKPDGMSNTVDYLIDRYMHMPMSNQMWLRTCAGENCTKLVSGAYQTMKVNQGILVPEISYQYLGNQWDIKSRTTEWNHNGAAKKIYRAYIGTTYSDDLVGPDGKNNYNPNYNYMEAEDGLPVQSYIKSPTEKLAHKSYSHYDNRLPKSELLIKGEGVNEVNYAGTYMTYDHFLREDEVYISISNYNGVGIPSSYKSKTKKDYKIKSLEDGENSIKATLEFFQGSDLKSVFDKTIKDDLGRDESTIQSNIGVANQSSYLLKSNTYNARSRIATTYDIGRDTKSIIYEDSPLGREAIIESQASPNGEGVNISFGTNVALDEVSGYDTYTLYSKEITDIDGRTVKNYADYLQRPIVERRYNDSGSPSDTRNIYDSKGRLMSIIPPVGPSYEYTYNDRGLVATKTVPHGGVRTYYYDELLRPVLEIDGNENMMVTVYDDFDRVIKTALIQNSAFPLPSSVNEYYAVDASLLTTEDKVLTDITYYPDTGLLQSESVLVLDPSSPDENIYMSKAFEEYDEALGLPISVTETNILGGEDDFTYEYNEAGAVIYSLHKHKVEGQSERAFQQKIYYDDMNRPWRTYVLFKDDVSKDGQLMSEVKYDEYARIKVKKIHEVEADEFLQEVDYTYDEFGRIIKINDPSTIFDNCNATTYCTYDLTITHESDEFLLNNLIYNNTSSIDLSSFTLNSGQDSETISDQIRQEIENQLPSIGGISNVVIDHISYTINQLANNQYELSFKIWQTDINLKSLEINSVIHPLDRIDCCGDIGPIAHSDLYWQELSYMRATGEDDNQELFNSTNIHRKDYGYACGVNRNFQYQYDALNRLHIAKFQNYENGRPSHISNFDDISTGLTGDYSTQINYQNDLGDIANIYRYAPGYSGNVNNDQYDLLDAISFTYEDHLMSGTTESGDITRGHLSVNANGENSYAYDDNGNIISDTGKGIDVMSYTHFNLPKSVYNGTTNEILQFVYSGSGSQLQKRYNIGKYNTISLKSYMSGIEYKGTSNADSQFDGYYHSDGIIRPNDDGGYDFQYYIKDHLGNSVILFEDKDKTGFLIPSDVIQENDYYPFGAKMSDAGTDEVSTDNQFQYNGKEMHREMDLNMYAYGARFYDPNTARFTGVDPIADHFAFVSVYNYAENTPIGSIDLHGLQEVNINSPHFSNLINDAVQNNQPERFEELMDAMLNAEFVDMYAAGLQGKKTQIPVATMNNLENGFEIWGVKGVYSSNATTGETQLEAIGERYLIYSSVNSKNESTDPIQKGWNSAIMKKLMPGLVAFSAGGTFARGPIGGTASLDFTWLTKGETSAWPVVTLTIGGASGKDIGLFLSAGVGYKAGDSSKLKRNMIPTTGNDYTIGGGGGAGIYGVNVTYTPSSQITMTSFQLTTPGGPSGSVTGTQSFQLKIPDFGPLKSLYRETYQYR